MNHAYRLVWNQATQTYVPAAEGTRARGKTGGGRAMKAMTAAVLAAVTGTTQALPTGNQTVAGQGSVSTSGSTMTITQQSQNLSLNWQGFSIANGETVRFQQPNAAAVALNRVIGSDPSSIYGALQANGQVFLINPNGILFAPGAQVNVGGLVASTLDITNDSDPANGRYKFASNALRPAGIVNQGTLTASPGGYIALLGGQVSNQGVIQAQLGSVALAAGKAMTLDFGGNKLLNLKIDEGALGALAENKQLIQADGGTVLMTAAARDAVLDTVVNNSGIIEARTLQNQGGTIKLLGDFSGGTVKVGGTIDASAPASLNPGGGNAGFVETSGAHVKIEDGAAIKLSASQGLGGKWLIDPSDITIDAAAASTATGTMNGGGTVTFNTAAGSGGSGDITVASAVNWTGTGTLELIADRDIAINANISGSNGGLTLNAAGNISAPAAVNVGTFTLQNGSWSQVGSGLAAFSATDFRISGGSFIRALGGDGASTATAYQLTDIYGVQGMGSAGMLNKNYVLANDINASGTSGWNSGAGFSPIGASFYATPNTFSGTLNGQGHIISGLTINRPGASYVGLFGSINLATISNLGLANAHVTGGDYTGGIVGDARGTIRNVYFDGEVIGAGWGVGGIAGVLEGMTIANAYFTGVVSGDTAGGIAGANLGTVTDVWSSASVTGTSAGGGLVGEQQGTLRNAYWDTSRTSSGTGINFGQITGLSGSAVYSQASYGNLDFTNTWWMAEGATRPFLRMEAASTVNNAHQLQVMAANPTGTYTLGSDINLAGLFNVAGGMWNPATGFAPIGNSTTAFTGSLDGQGHTISNLSITLAGQQNVGLFGVIGAGGSVSDLALSGSVAGGSNTGALAGQSAGTIDAVSSSVNVTGTSMATNIGGLIGQSSGTISDSYATGNVTGTFNAGGLVGTNSGTISDSHATGNVTGTGFNSTATGGLVGYNDTTGLITGTITGGTAYSTYASGNISVNDRAGGGLVGYNGGTIINAQASGAVSGSDATGGLVGNNVNGTISGSNATGEVSGWSYTGGLVGSSTGLILNSSATGTAAVWGLTTVGGLAGASTGTILDSYAERSVTGSGLVGGLVGIGGNTISRSHATGNVNGGPFGEGDWTGGLAGRWDSGTISDSYATGDVTGRSNVGGLVGAQVAAGTIIDSYATGNVTGHNAGIASTAVGGLVGSNAGTVTGTVTGTSSTTYAGGTVSGYTQVGGLVGSNTGTISGAVALGDVTGASEGIGGLVGDNVGGTIGSSRASGDVINIGGEAMTGGLVGHHNGGTITGSNATGSVSGGSRTGGLVGYLEAGDVINSSATGTALVEGFGQVGGLVGESWGSISGSYAERTVRGVGASVGGLVGVQVTGSTSNSHATGDVTGSVGAGGLIGWAYGTISSSYATGNVIGSTGTGGLAGNNGGIIIDSYATGNVSGSVSGSGTGGLVGNNAGTIIGTITGSSSTTYARGTVSGQENVGGLVGQNDGGTIQGTYASNASVSGSRYTGGLVGYNGGAISDSHFTGGGAVVGVIGAGGAVGLNVNPGTIDGVSSNASVTGDSSVGGLVGYYDSGTLRNSYYAGSAISGTSYIGGLIGTAGSSQAISNSFYNVDGVLINGASQVTAYGLYGAQFSDWRANGSLNVSGYYSQDGAGNFLVNNLTDMKNLLGFAGNGSYRFKLTGDIDLAGSAGFWLPVLNASFDGAGHVVKNISLSQTFNDGLGLFGQVQGSVSNLGLEGGSVTGNNYVGGLVGQNYGTLTNVHAGVAVSGTNYVGGLVGQNQNFATITGAYATGAVSGQFNVGGLAGYSGSFSTISDSYASGAAHGNSYVGGLVAYNFGSITNAYATGEVIAINGTAGGLIGLNWGTINQVWASGRVSGTGSTGGLIGWNNQNSIVSNGFWDTGTTGQADPWDMSSLPYSATNVSGISTAGAFTQASYGGLDFTNIWWMAEGGTRPFLRSEYSTTITNAHQLQMMGVNLSANYTLAADINLAGLLNVTGGMWNAGMGFSPVAANNTAFTGSLDGQGHTIANLEINRTASFGVGLFSSIGAAGSVRNLNLSGGNITGGNNVGALAGFSAGTIDTVSVADVNVAAVDSFMPYHAGGLVGYSTGSILNSSATGASTVSGGSYVGGLVGMNEGTISGSYAGVRVDGSFYAIGGLVGTNQTGSSGSGGIITGSHASGDVGNTTTTNDVGGLVGQNQRNATIIDSYATGNVSASTTAGGLVGNNYGTITGTLAGTASTTYASGAVSVLSWSGGGLAGENNGIIQGAAARGNVTGGVDIGGLVGKNGTQGLIQNVVAQGNVLGGVNTGGRTSTGGLVGGNYGRIINVSLASGPAVSSSGYVGGLVGYNFASGTISGVSVAGGHVTGNSEVGGLVGHNEGTITSAVADTMEVVGAPLQSFILFPATRIGGFAGYNSGSIADSQVIGNGSVTGNLALGGLVGFNEGSVSNSHYNVDTLLINGVHAVTTGGLYGTQFSDWRSNGTLRIADYFTQDGTGYYLVNDAQGMKNLLGFASETGYKFRLAANIDLSGSAGLWIPLLVSDFDGAGHTIANFSLNQGFSSEIGLFGRVDSGATVSNLGLTGGSVTGLVNLPDGSVSGSDSVGGLVGNNLGTLTNVYANVAVSGVYNDGGGLAGANRGTISASHAGGTVSGAGSGTGYVGGLVGFNRGVITGSYATGNVGDSSDAGGLVYQNDAGATISGSWAGGAVSADRQAGGLAAFNYGVISNAYATGSVSASFAGGLVSYNSSTGTITGAYATGATNAGYRVGGLVSQNDGTIDQAWASGPVAGGFIYGAAGLVGSNNGVLSNGYWDTTTTGQFGGAGGSGTVINLSGISGSDVYAQASYGGFDFGNVWWMAEGGTRPFLRSEWSSTITNARQLQMMGSNLSATYTLAGNIDLSGIAADPAGMWNAAVGFSPVGNSSTAFTGRLEGQGYAINNLSITLASQDNVGLFGVIGAGGAVSNLSLSGSVAGRDNTGALAGQSAGTIDAVSSSVNVNGTLASNIGGLVGFSSGTISNSYATGDVFGSFNVGGLAGQSSGAISDSYATGDVTGPGWVSNNTGLGGLVGYNSGTITGTMTGTTSTTYASGAVTGQTSSGGLVGVNAATGTISNVYATGNVRSFAGAGIGGLAGSNAGTISGSYATGDVMGAVNTAGGLAGTNYGLITDSYATGDVSVETSMAGGLVGSNYGSILNASATGGTIAAFAGGTQAYLGGLAGTNNGTISNSWSDSTITANGTNVFDIGGLVGKNQGGGTITASHASGTISAPAATSTAFGGLVGTNAGVITGSYAEIDVAGGDQVGGLVGNNTSTGSITDAYATGNVTGTTGVGGLVGSNAGSVNGTVSGTTYTTYASGTVSGVAQLGGLAGNNAGTITGAVALGSINASAANYVGGLVGDNSGRIDHSYASGNVSGYDYVGGLAGASSGTLAGVYATGGVSGHASVGGLAGQQAAAGAITGSFATGAVSATSGVGGLVGDNSGTIADSFALGSVVGNTGVGGLAGYNSGDIHTSYANGAVSAPVLAGGLVGNNSGTITDAYATGAVTGNMFAGGLIGENSGTVHNTYSTGLVQGSVNVGGLIGHNAAQVDSSFWDTTVNGALPGIAADGGSSSGVVGATTAQLREGFTGSFYSTNAGSWDFGSVWYAYGGMAPVLQSSPFVVKASLADAQMTYGDALPGVVVSSPYTGNFWGSDTAALIGAASALAPSSSNAGTYAWGATASGTSSTGVGYTVVFVPGTLTVNKATLNVTADSGQAKVYGDVDPTLGYTFNGLVNGDQVSVMSGLLGRGAGENVGNYNYALGSLTAGGNYALNLVAGSTFGITPKTLNVTATTGQGKVYGNSDAAFGYSTNAADFAFSDTSALLSGGLGRAAGENVGAYGYNQGSLTAGGNYTLNVVSSDSYAITPRTLNVTADAGQTKVYGNNDPASYGYTASNFAFSDTTALMSGGLGRVAGENVGTYGYDVGSLSAGGNYTINLVAGNFGITPRQLTVTADAGQGKVYGSSDAALNYGVAGLVNAVVNGVTLNDTVGGIVTGSLGRAAGENVGNYGYAAGSLTAGSNYTITVAASPTYAITPATITVTSGVTAGNKTYDGGTGAQVNTGGVILSGLQFSDVLGLDATGTFLDKNAGNGKTVVLGNYMLTGSAAGNYVLAASGNQASTTADITPRSVVVVANDQTRLAGTPNPELTAQYQGMVAGENPMTAALLSTLATGSSTAGDYAINASGAFDPNYVFTYMPGVMHVTSNGSPAYTGVLAGIGGSGPGSAGGGGQGGGAQGGPGGAGGGSLAFLDAGGADGTGSIQGGASGAGGQGGAGGNGGSGNAGGNGSGGNGDGTDAGTSDAVQNAPRKGGGGAGGAGGSLIQVQGSGIRLPAGL